MQGTTKVGDHIRLDNVSLSTPDGQKSIVRGVNFELKRCARFLPSTRVHPTRFLHLPSILVLASLPICLVNLCPVVLVLFVCSFIARRLTLLLPLVFVQCGRRQAQRPGFPHHHG
jgi:hypothetical protein